MYSRLHKKTIMVTGACGTVGLELIKQLLSNEDYSPERVIGIDNNESQLFFIDQYFINNPRAHFFVSDIRDKEDVIQKMLGVDVVFHCAALKHVVLCERSPEQALLTNIIGVQNIISAAKINNVETVIFTSSDKAVNPTNVMGTTKLMGERLMTAANSNKLPDAPVFASTRFGNVLGSNGSVIPVFHNQIKKGGPVTLTDSEMTRFVMSVEQAVRLVIESAIHAKGGEVFVTKMPVIRIKDLAQAMIEELSLIYNLDSTEINIIEIGTKPGEKLYEELMNTEETRRTVELERYFSVMPAFRGIYSDIEYNYEELVNAEVTDPYISQERPTLSVVEIKEILKKNNLLDIYKNDEIGERYWPGDKEVKD